MTFDEESSLLNRATATSTPRQRNVLSKTLLLCGSLLLFGGVVFASVCFHHRDEVGIFSEPDVRWEIPLVGVPRREQATMFTVPEPMSRCEWVITSFLDRDRDSTKSEEKTLAKYLAQSQDVNVFYRATAHIFWKDYAEEGWGERLRLFVQEDEAKINNHGIAGVIATERGSINAKSTWTWITGDQHLSNFGAWRNRHDDVVFGVNDFDEGAIYDFGLDVLRIAVSICNHAFTNKLKMKKIKKVLGTFTKAYIDTVEGYIGNEKAQLFELTSKTTYGKLQKFLKKVESGKSTKKQLKKFTAADENGVRYFIKGINGSVHEDTSLAAVPPEIEADLRAAFTAERYGATMMKLGWAVPQWDDEIFSILDVAQRVGSGIGSYGVDRYYVLLKGSDGLLENAADGGSVILDVKYEPRSAVHNILTPNDLAWYHAMFPNEAARVVKAQRSLTSYTDPFLGWIMLPDRESNVSKPFYVRQRSPWKDGPDLSDFSMNADDFEDFVAQVAMSTATSHVRGSVAKPPGDFKHSISKLLGGKRGTPWRKAVRDLAIAYRQQVLLDFECFHEYVTMNLTDASNKTLQ